MLSTMRSATCRRLSAARRPANKISRGFALQNVRHAAAVAEGGKEITLNLRIGQDVLPIRAQVGEALSLAAAVRCPSVI